MPTIYGIVDLLALVRSQMSAHLNALKIAMASGGISPALAAVYDDHWSILALAFPSISIGIEQAEPAYLGASTGTHRTDYSVRICLRVMIGNSNAYRDEVKLNQLTQSTINYLEERRILYDTATERIVWTGAAEARPLRNFDDTRTIGGELILMCRAHSSYTRA